MADLSPPSLPPQQEGASPERPDSLVGYLANQERLDRLGVLAEKEFQSRAAIVSEYHRRYCALAERFVALLETEAAQYLTVRQALEASTEAAVYRSPDAIASPRRHSSASPSRSAVASPRTSTLYLSAEKFLSGTARKGNTHNKLHDYSADRDNSRLLDDSNSSSRSPRHVSAPSLRVEVTTSYQDRLKQSTVKRMQQDLQDQAKIVRRFAEREERRLAALKRREQVQYQRVAENETRNSTAAVDHVKLQLQDVVASRTTREVLELKHVAMETANQELQLKRHAKSRALKIANVQTKQFVEQCKAEYDAAQCRLTDVAIAAHKRHVMSASSSTGSVVAAGRVRQCRNDAYRRHMRESLTKALDVQERQEHDEINRLVSEYPRPSGVEVSLSVAHVAPLDSSRVLLSSSNNQTGRATTATPFALSVSSPNHSVLSKEGVSSQKKIISDSQYARWCGSKEMALRARLHHHADPAVSGKYRSAAELTLDAGFVRGTHRSAGWK